MDEVRNEHKRIQLRELAALNGTLKDEVVSVPSSSYILCVHTKAVMVALAADRAFTSV